MTSTPPQRQDEGIWDRLRRRKVVQWGIAYVAGAWGLLQGVAYVRDTFGWPHQLQQAATLLLLIALPIVLVLAWYHGDRGEQKVTRTEFAILTLLFLLGGGLFWSYERVSDGDFTVAGSKHSSAAGTAGVSHGLRLAVLPLENLSPDPANAFFADGLHDEILSAMAATPDLQVVSRTTMRTYAGTRKTVKQIAGELGASHLLEGAVRRAGEQVRLTLQLIDARTDSNLWSQTFDRPLRDALSLQSEVAREVATALDVRLSPAGDRTKGGVDASAAPAATDPMAYDLYLKGKLQLDVNLSELDSPRAFDRLEAVAARAIEIDPGFANAYILRSRALLYRLWMLNDLTDEQWQTVGNDIESARRLAGETAAVLGAQASFEYYGHMDYGRALETTRAALERYPNDSVLRELEGLLLRRLGRWDEAIAVFRALANREPSNPNYAVNHIETLLLTHRHAEVLSAVHGFERRASPDVYLAACGAYASEAIGRDPETLRRFVDAWRDRLDPSLSWTIEHDYLRNSGRTEELASHLVAAKVEYIGDSARFGGGLLMPVAGLRGYGRLLQGARDAPDAMREVSEAAARISRLPSREWNIVLLEAHVALFSGDEQRAVEQARRALQLMTSAEDALLGPVNTMAAAIVLAWAGEGDEAVQTLRGVLDASGSLPAWAVVRDPLLAVPLAGNAAFEALKREVDPPA